MAEKNLYDVLGVPKDASAEVVKKAYKKLARKFHPDVNPGDKAAEERFKEVNSAFEVLSEPDKRRLYDEFGAEAIKMGFDPDRARSYRQYRDQPRGGFGGGGRGPAQDFDLEDLLGQAFRGGGRSPFSGFEGFDGFTAPPQQGPMTGADVEAEMAVDLIDALRGIEREIEIAIPTRCPTCEGSGTSSTKERCVRCGGAGRENVAQGPLRFQTICTVCKGTGKRPGPPCPSCGGLGTRNDRSRISVKVPPGVREGQKIRLRGKGHLGQNGGSTGDLLITIRVHPHPLLRREGDDLYMEVPVTVGEAMLGAKIDVPTLEGSVKLTIPAGSQTGYKLRLKAKGAPRKGGNGDLYVILSVRVPSLRETTPKVKEAVEEIEQHYTANPRSALIL